MRNNRLLWTLVLLIAFVGLTVSAEEVDGLVRRQDDKEATTSIRVRSTTTPSKTEEPTDDSEITPAPTETGSDEDSKDEDSKDEDSKDEDSKDEDSKDEGTGKTSIRVRTTSDSIRTRATTTKVPANSPPGGINMVTPAATDGFQLYPIGTQITWVYNYTSVLVSPTAINIEAFCQRTFQYYTIAQNYSVKETKVIWDTEEYQKTGRPLIAQETYTLLMYDAATQKTDVPQAGKLGMFRNFQFAMYTPRGNIPLDEYDCPTCNDASSLLQSHTVRVLLGTSFLVTVGFAWFVHGAM